jgi:hypothetical protein
MASAPRKTSRRHGHGKRLSRSRARTSAQELALAKALKPNKKFGVKTSTTGVEAIGKQTFYISVGGSDATCALKCALNLFGSDSSTSDGETVPIDWSCKRSKETSLAQDIPKSYALKGIFE